MAKRILITGGSSYLGQHLLPLARKQFDICYTYFSKDTPGLAGGRQLDLRDSEQVQALATEFKPETIIHLAGSDRSPDMSAVILEGAQNIVQAARTVNARLIHFSTDVVFDGKNGPYTESDPPSPIHDYGRAKAAAEAIVASHSNHVIVRTSLIYSLRIMDYATQWLINSLQSGKGATLFDDQYRNPADAETLSHACLELAGIDYRGTLNIAGDQVLNRVAFGLKMLEWWGVEERQGLSSGPSPDTWPKDCRLDLTLAKQLLATPLPGLDAVLAAHDAI